MLYVQLQHHQATQCDVCVREVRREIQYECALARSRIQDKKSSLTSGRHLPRFERASPLTLLMRVAADLGIALVISESPSPKATDQQAESTGHTIILDDGPESTFILPVSS
jgi:hypothetical protein